MLLRYFNPKMGIKDIGKPTTGNESTRQDTNDNGIRIVNVTTHKKSNCYEHDVPAPKHS
jgi:hypothetical protein